MPYTYLNICNCVSHAGVPETLRNAHVGVINKLSRLAVKCLRHKTGNTIQ